MTVLTLPENYRLLRKIDLQKDRKLAILVNVLAIVISVSMLFLGMVLQGGFTVSLSLSLALRMIVLGAGVIVYMVLHELTHGLFMYLLSGTRPRYGFNGLYAYAGSDAFFPRAAYIWIALSPVLLLGIVLWLLSALLPPAWFWCCYLIQVVNISGAAGDFYVTALMLFRLPKDTLTRDHGVGMEFYTATKA